MEEARRLPNPEIHFFSLPIGQSLTQSSTGAIPKAINRSAEDRRAVQNNSNQSLFCDGIDLPVPEISKSTNHQPDTNETFQIDSFLKDNNQFLAEANKLLKHYDEQVIREREKFIKEIGKNAKTKA